MGFPFSISPGKKVLVRHNKEKLNINWFGPLGLARGAYMAYYMRMLDAKFKKPPIIGLEVHL